MRIAVLGSGGREHVLAWKLRQSPDAESVIVIPGNGGTAPNRQADLSDFPALHRLLREEAIDLVVVGPEQPLVAGIVDWFHGTGIRVFGPGRDAAQLEGSKIRAKEFMRRHGVATGSFEVCGSDIRHGDVIRRFGERLVIKYDGLAAGKGVFVCDSFREAEEAVSAVRAAYGTLAEFLIEERLEGQELSIIGITDGEDIQLLLPSQDHKQAHDGDTGPNTGGMGAYCPVPFCDDAMMSVIRREVVEPTVRGLREEGLAFRGVIYFGLMITDEGPKLLEYNVRFGDPEAEVILPSLASDLLPLITSCFDGTLRYHVPRFRPDVFIDVVLVSGGYPGKYRKGFPITGLERLSEDVLVFHAGTRIHDGELVTSGGRVLNLVVSAPTLPEAIRRVYREVGNVRFQDSYHRTDIGMRVTGEVS